MATHLREEAQRAHHLAQVAGVEVAEQEPWGRDDIAPLQSGIFPPLASPVGRSGSSLSRGITGFRYRSLR
jgi:hypothetical protein